MNVPAKHSQTEYEHVRCSSHALPDAKQGVSALQKGFPPTRGTIPTPLEEAPGGQPSGSPWQGLH